LVGEQMLDRPSPKQIRKRIGENAPKKDWNNQPVSACFLQVGITLLRGFCMNLFRGCQSWEIAATVLSEGKIPGPQKWRD
jgi:hypothetical protein